ncbi:MAG: hypothetical protein KAG99_11280, partial [Bacteroidales bacterium]|nr:hypothetical protein [Bacteroidales bacterium]
MLVFNIYRFLDIKEGRKWILTFALACFISIISGVNHFILSNIILLFCNYFNYEKSFDKLLAFLLIAFAFYIKSFAAILSGIIGFSFIAYYFLSVRNYKKTGLDILTIIGLVLLFWLIMYGTFSGFIKYVIGMFHLAVDNSSAASYYPYNNWWVLSIFLLTIFSFPFINKTKKSFFYGSLVALSLFAAWKHGMAREEIYHVQGLLIYVLIVLFLFILFNKTKPFINLSLSIIALMLLTINMQYSVGYFSSKYELFRVNNFIEFVSDFSKLKSKATRETEKNISSNKLPPSILDSISNATVDIYPWDYSIIPANNLKWQPRVVIQSYAAYTSWLDRKNAEHYKSKIAPEFIIWEKDKLSRDVNGGDFNSIDNRYLLNDEPQTIVQLINNYKFYYADNKFLVLKKRANSIKSNHSIIKKNSTPWSEWINVPESSDGLLRAKMTFKKSLLQRLKSFFYKGEQFWIYLKLQNGVIHKYRIVPKNAEDGIWINPYIFNSSKYYQVKQIMLKCSNQKIMSDNLAIEWEQTEFKKEPDCLFNFFNINDFTQDSIVLSSINTFEKLEITDWNKLTETLLSDTAYLGVKSFILKANSFSSAFAYAMDSLSFENLKILADCWVKSPDYKYTNNTSLVLSINDKNGTVIYKGLSVDGQLIDKKQWNNIYNFIDYKHIKPNCTLKAYIWNKSDKDI